MGKHHASFEDAFLSAGSKAEREKAVNQFFNRSEMVEAERKAQEDQDRAWHEEIQRKRARQDNLVAEGLRIAEDRKANGPLDTRQGSGLTHEDEVIIAMAAALRTAWSERCYCWDD